MATAALAWWRVLSPAFAAELMRFHIMLAAFNLLPALPLDGGRALFALARTAKGRAKMLTALTLCGYALALLLAGAALVGWARTGTMNLAILLPAIFLAASGSREKRGAALGVAEALAERLRPDSGALARPKRMRLLAVDEETQALEVLRALAPREEALIAVYRSGMLARLLDSRALEQALLRAGDAPPADARYRTAAPPARFPRRAPEFFPAKWRRQFPGGSSPAHDKGRRPGS